MLHAAPGMGDFVGRHGGIADKNHLVVRGILVQHIPGGEAFRHAPPIVLPHRFIDEVVEVEILHVLELGARRGEELFADLHVRIHGAAHVEEAQHLHRVLPLRLEADIEKPAVMGRGPDGPVHVELFLME